MRFKKSSSISGGKSSWRDRADWFLDSMEQHIAVRLISRVLFYKSYQLSFASWNKVTKHEQCE